MPEVQFKKKQNVDTSNIKVNLDSLKKTSSDICSLNHY